MTISAFAPTLPLSFPQRTHQQTPRRPYRWSKSSRARISACLPQEGDTKSPATTDQKTPQTPKKEGISKTEEIAALIGQSKETMTASRDEMTEQIQLDNRRKYGLALASTLIATGFFLEEKFNPNAGINLLRFMEANSAPLTVVGTNNKPTFVEFGATWCENCKLMARSIFELENEYVGKVNFLIVDGDDPNNADIIEKFGVDGIPQFSLVDSSGTVKANIIGRVPKQILAQDLDALLQEKPVPFPGFSLDELRNPDSS